MTILMQTNIDTIRAKIMSLEVAPIFDQDAWEMALADLRAAGRLSALADAERRMETARCNQQMQANIVLMLVPVAMETAEA